MAYNQALRVLEFGLAKTAKSDAHGEICSSAVQSRDLGVVKVAVERGALLTSHCFTIYSPLEEGCLPVLKYLVSAWCPMEVNSVKYPVVSAADCGQLGVVKYLVSSKIVEMAPTLVDRVLFKDTYRIVNGDVMLIFVNRRCLRRFTRGL